MRRRRRASPVVLQGVDAVNAVTASTSDHERRRAGLLCSGSSSKSGRYDAEHQPEQRRIGEREIRRSRAGGDELRARRLFGARLRLSHAVAEALEADSSQRRQQRVGVLEMMGRRSMRNAGALGAAAQREPLDAFFGEFRFGRVEQRLAQVAVVIGVAWRCFHVSSFAHCIAVRFHWLAPVADHNLDTVKFILTASRLPCILIWPLSRYGGAAG